MNSNAHCYIAIFVDPKSQTNTQPPAAKMIHQPIPIKICGKTHYLSHFTTSANSTPVVSSQCFPALSLPTFILELFSASSHKDTTPQPFILAAHDESGLN